MAMTDEELFEHYRKLVFEPRLFNEPGTWNPKDPNRYPHPPIISISLMHRRSNGINKVKSS